jgi:hypothetical protein
VRAAQEIAHQHGVDHVRRHGGHGPGGGGAAPVVGLDQVEQVLEGREAERHGDREHQGVDRPLVVLVAQGDADHDQVLDQLLGQRGAEEGAPQGARQAVVDLPERDVERQLERDRQDRDRGAQQHRGPDDLGAQVVVLAGVEVDQQQQPGNHRGDR